jgi:hypothetical protein
MPETSAERTAVHEQLERILASSLFKNSKRYPNLLRYVVERSLQGHTENLKERSLGIEVFGRDPDYDTNADPVVRTTATEIRKRIAQYYHEPGHETEIRIDFPPGTYLPEFRVPEKTSEVFAPPPSEESKSPQPRRTPARAAGILAAAVFALAAVLLTARLEDTKPIDRFWEPVLKSPEPALLYVSGNPSDPPLDTGANLRDLHLFERIGYADATAMTDIGAFLAKKNKPFKMRFETFGRLDELREGPAVLIGAFNNSWALRAMNQLRFTFIHEHATDLSWIQDRQNPQSRKWSHVMNQPYANMKEDYAVLTRALDPTTGQTVITASGLAKFGTAAVGEFLANPSEMAEIAKAGRPDWYRKNMQMVLATSVVGLSPGPAHIIATYFW